MRPRKSGCTVYCLTRLEIKTLELGKGSGALLVAASRDLRPSPSGWGARAAAMAAANEGPSKLEKEQMFGMAEKEMEYRVDLFNRYKESELNMGENSCIDRCN
uniref:Uncharacterized protein n=1 Tax=Leersia perrieri TaxID=77586 RepID=A0A0D9W0W2_9ORYZ